LQGRRRVLLLKPLHITPERGDGGISFGKGALGAPAHFVRPPQLGLQVVNLTLQGLALLLVHQEGGIGLGVKVRAACLSGLVVPPLELLLHADPPLVQHVVHLRLEGSLALVQRFLALGQLIIGPAGHRLPALEDLSLPVEPVLEGMELLLVEAKSPLAFAGLCFSDGEPSLLQAQALCPRVSALLTSVEEGLPVLDLIQPLLGVGEKAIGVCPGLVQEVLSCPLGLLPSQGWVGRPDSGGNLLVHLGDDLHGLFVRPGQVSPRLFPGVRQSFLGLLDHTGADLLCLLPRPLAALSGMLVQEAASLRGLVQEGPALLDARLLGRAHPGNLIAEGAGGSRRHPCPWVGGVRLSGDPRG
jgi:hypothetical protein